MSQNDFTIANQLFPITRQDINDALQALASLSSGSSAPSTTYPNMLWYDTGNNILKMRTEADDAWIDVGYLCQSTNKFCIFDDTNVVNSSGTQVGLIGDQPTSDWEAGTSTTESLVSPAKVKAAIEANLTGLGIGQTWQDVSASRVTDTTYFNNTGKPIMVNIFADGSGDTDVLIYPASGGSLVIDRISDEGASTSFIVPNGDGYRISSSISVFEWSELR